MKDIVGGMLYSLDCQYGCASKSIIFFWRAQNNDILEEIPYSLNCIVIAQICISRDYFA